MWRAVNPFKIDDEAREVPVLAVPYGGAGRMGWVGGVGDRAGEPMLWLALVAGVAAGSIAPSEPNSECVSA